MQWREETDVARSDIGIVIRQRGPYRVLISNVNGMTDSLWYYLWFSSPHTSMKPMPDGLMDCVAIFVDGTIKEWQLAFQRAEERMAKRKKPLTG